ncbi:hypothetical protein [Niabella drilacis]|uniref:Uncharacterized protein n=1 Tax=Niabella drilacis (strain DSM 25811 / CCM 8410 / CCUG 62505 / LMG 26954 / E90) TaxID=1285928 RepID=A0A1G6RZR7_NIADE|nr:hypothetical protein [Niabella drilacis]SDD09901.1 hypothetical protein SAMN04487894_10618 [Niabella drilacis]
MRKPFTILKLLPAFILLLASGCHKNDTGAGDTPTTAKPVINSFTVSAVTMSSATFNFSASGYTSLSISIDGGAAVNVSGTSE